MICDRKVWSLSAPPSSDSCRETAERSGTSIVVMKKDPTFFCTVDWFQLVCSFQVVCHYFLPVLQTAQFRNVTFFAKKIEGRGWQ